MKKILWHRVAIVCVVALILVSIVGMSVYRLVAVVWSPLAEEKEVSKKVIEDKASAPIEEKKYTVVIDAGHGGYDGGSGSANGLLEKDITLSIALCLGEILEKNEDIQVVYTREDDNVYWTNDNAQDLMARINVATENKADLFISLHMNASEEGKDIKGYDVWVSPTSQDNIVYSNTVNDALASLSYTQSRGIKDETLEPLMVLHLNPQPSILVEMGFISNEEDLHYLTSKEGQKKLAQTLADAMSNTLLEIRK